MVFGSNEAGLHGKGAAADARDFYGAIRWKGLGMQGVGRYGTSYGIPTKDRWLRILTLDHIHKNVDRFLEDARLNTTHNFLVTRIGCGLAGYTNEQIAPMFIGAPGNCGFDPEWLSWTLKTWAKAPFKI
jgi:hypothetical protein